MCSGRVTNTIYEKVRLLKELLTKNNWIVTYTICYESSTVTMMLDNNLLNLRGYIYNGIWAWENNRYTQFLTILYFVTINAIWQIPRQVSHCRVYGLCGWKLQMKNNKITNYSSPYSLFKINALIEICFWFISATTRDVKCDEGWEEFSSHCYYFPDEHKDWTGARVCD